MRVISPSLATSPHASQWLRLTDDGQFELRTGKVELGQGISAALTQIACETLGVLPTQVRWVAGDTCASPDEGYTAGSQSIEVGGEAWRHVGHVVRSHFAQAAAQHWYGTSASQLTKSQAAGIAAILPNPRKYKATNSSSYIENRKGKIMRIMRHSARPEY